MRQYVSFTGLHAGTGELSLGLHASRQLSDKVLRSHLLLSRPLPRAYTIVFTRGNRRVAISRGLPMSPWGSDFIFTALRRDRRKVSEGSDLVSEIGLPCGLSAPCDCYRDCGTHGCSEFPAYGRFLLRLAYGTLRGS